MLCARRFLIAGVPKPPKAVVDTGDWRVAEWLSDKVGMTPVAPNLHRVKPYGRGSSDITHSYLHRLRRA
jgi:hypothetical protein